MTLSRRHEAYWLGFCVLITLATRPGLAEGPPAPGAPPGGAPASAPPKDATDRTSQPESEDFSTTPYMDYGEFNEQKSQEETEKFFQHGRFFGVSLGLGSQGVTGNRGALYNGGFPLIDFKVHAWFDFNFALELALSAPTHYFTSTARAGAVDVNVFFLGAGLRYYIDTQNLGATISFANPHLLLGGGAYRKAETNQSDGVATADTAMGLNGGAGLEFAIKPRNVYFSFEGRYHFVLYKDRFTTEFQSSDGLATLEGGFFTVLGQILFTW